MDYLTALGTGHATATKCYTTCFSLSDGKAHFLIDSGGGNGILTNLEKCRISLEQIHHAFLSHKHTDHILGAIWLIRMVGHGINRGSYQGTLTIYAHKEVLLGLEAVCRFTLPSRLLPYLGERILFYPLEDGLTINILGRETTFFDTGSVKDIQYGCRITLHNQKVLTFLGDEPYREKSFPYASKVDYLMHEALCLYRDAERFSPYAIGHTTVKEACENAGKLQAKGVILHHTEDGDLAHRKTTYIQEGQTFFQGQIYCPDDLDTITL